MAKQSEEAQAANNAITGSEALGVAFVVLKLLGVLDWSWFWVTAPFWMPLALIVVISLFAIVVIAVKELFS